MSDISTIEESREVLRRLELEITLRLDGLLQGDRLGIAPGHGSELGESRPYQPGDDVRRIDWNITARLSDPHIRQTIADHELTTYLIVDTSARTNFGTINSTKKDLALSAAAAIGYMNSGGGSRIGAVIASGNDTTIVPAKSSRDHVRRILHSIQNSPSADGSGSTDLGAAINSAMSLNRRRGFIVVISDFLVEDNWVDSLSLASVSNQVLAIQLTDKADLNMPNIGHVTLLDPATQELVDVNTSSDTVRTKFAEAANLRQSKIDKFLQSCFAPHLKLDTGSDWLEDIVEFVNLEKRLQHSRRRS